MLKFCRFKSNLLNDKVISSNSIGKLILRLSSAQRSQFDIFDRKTKLKQKTYSLKLPNHNIYDYLKNEFGFRLFDSLLDIKR